MDVAKAVSEVKAGAIDFKVDKYGIVHASIGRFLFCREDQRECGGTHAHTDAFEATSAKGTYVKHLHVFNHEQRHTGRIKSVA